MERSVTSSVAPGGIPVRLGSPADFATVRSFLADAGYTESAVSGRTGVPTIYDFRALRDGRTAGLALADRLDCLIRLFLDTEPIDQATLAGWFPGAVLEALDRLGLLFRRGDRTWSSVLLYPTEELLVISDHTAPPAGAPGLGEDVVYPAVTRNTRTFLEMLPRTPCDSFLEVCGGTGIAALVASRFAREAWTSDITARAASFAEFNARLNGLVNVTSLRGDLYAPVRDRTFNRIAAHPPYVAATEQRVIFRDGGRDGEQILRRVLAEAPDRLAPGGMLYLTCVATDRKEGRLEQRLRELLGSGGAECDLVVISRFETDPVAYRAMSLLRSRGSLQELSSWNDLIRELGIEVLVYAHIYLRRREGSRPVFTRRCRMASGATPAEVAWLLEVEAALAEPAVVAGLLSRRARVIPTTRLNVRYRYDEDAWVPAEAMADAPWPFPSAARAPVWLADLLVRCAGTVSLGEIVAEYRRTGLIGEDVADGALAGLVKQLVASGLVAIEGIPAPPPPPPREASHAVA
jgi:SAM-dependent methyltransferase